MKKSQLKTEIKNIVREAIKEKCSKGKLSGGEKGKRMFKHIKKGYKGEKDPEDAERIAAATVNKNLGEAGATSEECKPEGHGYSESEEIKLIKAMAMIAKKLETMHKGDVNEGGPQYKVASDHQYRCVNCNPALNNQYDPKMLEEKEEETIEETAGRCKICGIWRSLYQNGLCKSCDRKEEETRSQDWQGAMRKRHGLSDQPEDVDEENVPVDFKQGVDFEQVVKILDTMVDVVDRNPELVKRTLQMMSKKLKQDNQVGEASYKKVSPNETDTSEEDKARTIQTDPEVTENHKVQARSYVTVNDAPNDPNNTRDPENPQSNGA